MNQTRKPSPIAVRAAWDRGGQGLARGHRNRRRASGVAGKGRRVRQGPPPPICTAGAQQRGDEAV